MAKRKPKAKAKRSRKHVASPAAQQRAFLAAYAVTGIISRASEASGVNRQRHSDWLKSDPAYAELFAEAKEVAIENLETEAQRRAKDGIQRLKFYQGELIRIPLVDGYGKQVSDNDGQPIMVPYVEHDYSDTLLMFMLKALRPDVYRERVESKVTGSLKVENNTNIRVVEDRDWYGNANRVAAASDGASIADHLVAGAIQGAGVRPTVGQNGNGNGKSH